MTPPRHETEKLSVLVAAERDAQVDLLLRELRRAARHVIHLFPVTDQLPAEHDIIVADINLPLSDQLPWVPGEASAALILLLPENGQHSLKKLRACCPDAVLHRPFQPSAIQTSLVLARNQFQFIRRLRSRIARLDENIKAIRDIERAKSIIMDMRRVGEDEAYAYLRSQAMERRTTVASFASHLVDSHQLLG
ncbi:MAG: ANTAR domain-containing protein [Pseudolabrys sp.]|jgi:AmiR/NasT family two-component response regulator